MSTISVHGIQPRLAGYAIILVIAALSGRMIAESLPATDLYVLFFMPDMTEGVSSYLGLRDQFDHRGRWFLNGVDIATCF